MILTQPQSSVYLIFLPFVPIKSIVVSQTMSFTVISHVSFFTVLHGVRKALGGLVTLDVVGLIRGWQVFDHASHLGGAFFAV